jgi:biotin carboxylase
MTVRLTMPHIREKDRIPHLLLICPRSDILGKLLGLPVALTIVHRPGGDRTLEDSLALRVIDVDFTNCDALLEAAREVHAWRPIDAVLGLTELSLLPASIVGTALGARANAVTTVRYAQDKAAMRKRLRACGVDTTAYRVCASIDDARSFASEYPDGIIVKPVNGNGGTGIFLVRESVDLDTAWEWTTTSTGGWEWQGQQDRGLVVLAEEYLTGREYSIETISADGKHLVLAVTAKHTTGPPYFVEIGHDQPAPLSSKEYNAITEAALNALDGIGYAWGPCHTEVMLRDDGECATVVEINVRQGGDQIWELVGQVTGVDMIAGSVATLAYGELPTASPFTCGGAAIRYLTPEPGRVTSIDGVDDALAVEGVIRVSELCKVGDVVKPLGNSWNRTGYVIAAGPDTKQAVAAAELAASIIVIKTVADG